MKATVATVMTRDMVVAHPTTPYQELVRLFRAHDIVALPVVDSEGRLVGTVSQDDLRRRQQHRRVVGVGHAAVHGRSAAEVMSKAVATLTPDATVAAAAQLLRHRGVRQLAVVDPDGRLVGIVSRRDLLAVFLRPDEEIGDEIQRRILGVLLGLDPGMVSVEVRGGVVNLRGYLPWRTQAHELVALVGAVDGVVAVDDQLTIGGDDLDLDRALATATTSATVPART